MLSLLDKSLDYLKGVGPQRAQLLATELQLFTYRDLLEYYPFRYEDRTQFYKIKELSEEMTLVQVIGQIRSFKMVGAGPKQRLSAQLVDDTGEVELVWFQGIKWVTQKLKAGVPYVVFGKPARYGASLSIAHPEVEPVTEANTRQASFFPVYNTTEKLKKKFIDSKVINKMVRGCLMESLTYIGENLPEYIVDQLKLTSRAAAISNIHFPKDQAMLEKARFRLKFEELLIIQLQLIRLKLARTDKFKGLVFNKSHLLNDFYANHLPFDLTQAQKRVVKEIYADLRTGHQMNRLVQGDVGSGKTMVAFLSMLIAISNGTQCAMMAPTEILAEQHYRGLGEYAEKMGLQIRLLTGSTKQRERNEIHELLMSGALHILVGTHALLEEKVQFHQLGLAVIDEQHRFGVAQRGRLWQKTQGYYPHVLVMTATPIPRTLAMTLYGDLDISVIDELPAGRKPIQTLHMRDAQRIRMFGMLEQEIKKGRQAYIVYPLIEESEQMDYKDLMDGYESVARRYPDMPLSIVHGRMKSDAKEFEMKRFVKGETKIMVATTVIEVGVNVPNATVMVIENAERFGLSQLHQLRGRVGRGGDQSYCILMTGLKLTTESKQRIQTMVETNDGFRIAETDLKLRGPGDLMGTKQSGLLDLKIADLAHDAQILTLARNFAIEILRNDPQLIHPENQKLKVQLDQIKQNAVTWSRIS